jgi:type II secretory pathway pseudopilin PulG
MKKYYIGVLVLLALCVGALGYTISQSGAAKQDKATDKAVEDISIKLDTYISEHGSTPKSLAEAGLNDMPSTVSYQALSTEKYKICFDYHTASSNFDAGWGSLLFGGITGNSSYYDQSGDGSYFNSSVETTHKKGQNCQTVTPYLYSLCSGANDLTYGCDQTINQPINSLSNNAANSACESDTSAMAVAGSATIKSVNSTAKTITLDTSNQYLYDKSGNSLPAVSKVSYDTNTLFCDANFKKADATVLQSGKDVAIYMKNSGDTVAARVDVY